MRTQRGHLINNENNAEKAWLQNIFNYLLQIMFDSILWEDHSLPLTEGCSPDFQWFVKKTMFWIVNLQHVW